MKLGINWIALALLVAVFVVMQMRNLSLRLRCYIVAALYALIGLSVLRGGVQNGFNLAIAGLAFFFSVRYAFQGMRSHSR